MVQESAPSTQLSVPQARLRLLGTGHWPLASAMLSTNVGSIALDRKISDAGHACPGIRADGDAVRRHAAGEPLRAPAHVGKRAWKRIRSRRAAGNAMSSRYGAIGEPAACVMACSHIRTFAPIR